MTRPDSDRQTDRLPLTNRFPGVSIHAGTALLLQQGYLEVGPVGKRSVLFRVGVPIIGPLLIAGMLTDPSAAATSNVKASHSSQSRPAKRTQSRSMKRTPAIESKAGALLAAPAASSGTPGVGTIGDVYTNYPQGSTTGTVSAFSTGAGGNNDAESGGAGFVDALFTDGSGNVFEGPADNSGTLRPVVPRSAPVLGTCGGSTPAFFTGTCPYFADMSLDPTGALVAYVNADGTLHVADASTGNNDRPLGVWGYDPVWSPSGKWIAFLTGNYAFPSLAMVMANGSGKTKVLVKGNPDTDTSASSPSWFPDSMGLAAVVGGSGLPNKQDVAIITINKSGAPVGSPTYLGVSYYHDLGPDTTPADEGGPGEEFDKFTPSSVAVSPDGNSLAVAGLDTNCTEPAQPPSDQAGYVVCNDFGGEPPESITVQNELGTIPASGGPFSGAAIVKQLGIGCLGGYCSGGGGATGFWNQNSLYWTGTATYVAMGDSFSSGAYSPYTSTSGACGRSTTAYPLVSGLSPLFVACSGADTEDMSGMGSKGQPSQVAALSDATTIVSVTAGGDNANLFKIFFDCIGGRLPLQKDCATGADAGWAGPAGTGNWIALQKTLATFFQLIHTDAKNASIYVMGYPNPLPQNYPPLGCDGLSFPLWAGLAPDWQFLYNLTAALDDTIDAAVTSTGLSAGVLQYVHPNSNFVNACSDGSDFISMGQFFASNKKDAVLHPNANGQDLMAASLVAAIDGDILP